MKLLILLLTGLLFNATADVKELEVGKTGPMFDVKMTTTEGTETSLAQIKKANGTLLIFTSNTCPWVHAWENRYNEVAQLAAAAKVGVIFVNSNEATRNEGESLADMRNRKRDKGYTFPYALDKDHKLADAYGATRTPHVYLLDKNNKLVFVGAIDDNSRDRDEVDAYYIKDALADLSAGRPIATPTSRALGCTIKRL
jgi:peroxiredoxin